MKHGGKREGAGRKPGSASVLTREIADKAAEGGELPLEYMLRVQRDSSVDHERRDKMAIAAAPFIHPKLQASENKHTHDVSDPLLALLEHIANDGKRIHDRPKTVS
jgi:hypothetical protein